MSAITFETKLVTINSWIILIVPPEASAKLPSRGMTMVAGTFNGVPFKTVLEPNGRYAPGQRSTHWFRPDRKLLEEAHVTAGNTVQISLAPTKEWIEPEIPADMQKALSSSPKAEALWKDITPMARWDWLRWVRAVKTQETREKHLEVMLDKLHKGMRRPCCFNRNLCSEPHVAHNWILLEPTSE
ncbi:MAG TPA: YdeI/OmpD-associated family protein [Candidatus Saccharimonadales bacterium]|nr:YdeI/OmpD-associated family protein [Candidatus Saccharimonadales bacterium]